MATNIGTLMATVGVDTRPLKKGLKDAEQQTKASTTKMLSHWKSMAVGIVATYALYKTANLVKETALLAARFETLDIVMKTVGKNAGYSAEQMDQYDLALRKTGISMIESRRTLAMMTQAQLDLSKATELGRIAQDAAVIGNINSSEAFQRMIYGIQTGNLVVLRRIGINVSFEKSYKAVAKATDRTVESFTESEKAMIRQNAVIQYGTRIAGTYEAAMGTAGKKLTSFVRYVEDFKVKMGKAFGPATVTLVDAATQAMKEMQEQISRPEAQEALRELSSQLATTIVKIGKDLPEAIETMATAVNSLANAFSEIIRIWTHPVWDKMDEFFGIASDKDWQAGMAAAAGKMAPEFHKMPEHEGINQAERMEKSLAGGGVSRLSTALEDPDKYYGEMNFPEQIERTKEYYKQLEVLAQEKMDFMLELEDEEMRIFRENLDYRLELKQQYYKDIEAAAQEARDLEEEMEDQKIRMARETAAYQKRITEDEVKTRLSFYQSMAGGISGIFSQIAQAGGKQSEEAFRMYQAFAIIEATIAANLAAAKVVGQLGIFGIPLSSMVYGMAMANVAMIAAAQPPSYDQGGVSDAKGIYQTGNIREAHIPIPSGGKIPVKVEGKENQTVQIIMNNPTFQDLETQRQVMIQIASVVASQVAPGAVVENYNNDGEIRRTVRGGI